LEGITQEGLQAALDVHDVIGRNFQTSEAFKRERNRGAIQIIYTTKNIVRFADFYPFRHGRISKDIHVFKFHSSTASTRNNRRIITRQDKNDYKTKEAQMKKCTVCGKQVDRLNYGDLKIRAITQIEVLGEKAKSKSTTLNLTLCKDCRTEISG
jgi:hypothetical protein